MAVPKINAFLAIQANICMLILAYKNALKGGMTILTQINAKPAIQFAKRVLVPILISVLLVILHLCYLKLNVNQIAI